RLYNQIMQGAPFDLLIAADEERPKRLLQHGKAIASQRVGQGYLGLMIAGRISMNTTQLQEASIHRIALANPDVAPFGVAARKLLQQQGLWQILKPKFIYAQSAMQAAMMVQQGLVDAGFIPIQQREQALANIPYTAVLMQTNAAAASFMQSLSGDSRRSFNKEL
ncbi:MAG: molybdate ABC transporter substrate-binding protein, partial [Mariprofundaceae bacterium]|nr:molybdate ABC transporter substrate-binding protein [Mariprofundaceae bacterium]